MFSHGRRVTRQHRAAGVCPALAVLTVFAFVSPGVQAGPVFTITDGTLTVTGFFTSDTTLLDIRGMVVLDVTGLGPASGPLLLADPTGGTDPGGYVLPLGNTRILALDSDSAISFVTAQLLFDFDQGLVDGDYLFLPATASAVPPDGVPGPILAMLIGNNPIAFTFLLSDFADLGDGNYAYQWQLTSVEPAPEPGSLLLAAGGLAILAARRRRSRRQPVTRRD